MFVMIEGVVGMIAAAPTPISAREAISSVELLEITASNEPAPKIAKPTNRMRLRPNRSPRLPAVRSSAALIEASPTNSEGAGTQAMPDAAADDTPVPAGWREPRPPFISAALRPHRLDPRLLVQNRLPPENLIELVPKIAPRPIFLIHGGADDSGHRNPDYFRVANPPKQIWEAQGGHTDGIAKQPAVYERRVVAFFDEALLR
jgi:hypothetical protein